MRRLLLLVLLQISTPARAEWWEAKTEHFIVDSQSSAREAQKFAERLERFDMSLRSLQHIQFSPATSDSHRLTVFRSGDTGDIGVLYGGSGVAGFYIPRLVGSVAFVPAREKKIGSTIGSKIENRSLLDSQTVLFHEYSHHFMFQHFSAAYPAWYVEGFAEFYSTLDLKDDGSFHVGNAPQSRGDALLGWLNLSVKRMLISTNKPNGVDVYGRYTFGWLLTHFLTFESNRAGQLKQYLRLINSGTDPSAAASQAFGDLDKLERDIHRYLGNRLPGADVRPANYTPPTVAMRRLGPDEEAVMRVRMRSDRGVNRKTAKDVAADARGIAAKYPQSVPVQLAVAEAEFDAERFNEAEAAADRALALNPNAIDALLYKGRVYLERGKNDPRQLATARTWFAKAYKADPEHPGPLYFNYMTYFRSGGAIPESALVGLEHAFKFAPFDPDLRLVLARQLLAERDGPLARSIIMPFALAPHESKGAQALRDVVDLIDQNKLDESYTKLAAEMARREEQRKSGKEGD